MAVVTIGSLVDFFNKNKKAFNKGENALICGHLINCQYDSAGEFLTAQATV